MLLIVPGLLFSLMVRKHRASWAETPFIEISRTVLASMVFSLCGLVVAVLLWKNVAFFEIEQIRFIIDMPYRVEKMDRFVILSAISTVVACGIAALVATVWSRIPYNDQSESNIVNTPNAAWFTVFHTYRRKGSVPFAQVNLVNGGRWLGKVAGYTLAKQDARTITLAGPLAYSKDANSKIVNLPSKWTRVVIEGAQISSVAVQYLTDKKRKGLPREVRRQRAQLRKTEAAQHAPAALPGRTEPPRSGGGPVAVGGI